MPLPFCRTASGLSVSGNPSDRITYGDYFDAVTSFLSRDDFAPIFSAVQSLYHFTTGPDALKAVRIFLVKHGEFYHPSRVEADISGTTCLFVLNVAVSGAGITMMENEYHLLRRLGGSYPYRFLPRVFSYGETTTGSTHPIGLFLGEWFEGFCEFHLSRDPSHDEPALVVWDDDVGNYFLNKEQILQAYEQAAKIITLYYNVSSFEQIFSWHHAAGDFILKTDRQDVDVRLITVRSYRPLIKTAKTNSGAWLDSLLMFFLILSIRMRLDRIDGTGEYAWAGDEAVKGAVSGFVRGLNLQADEGLIPGELANGFHRYLSSFSVAALLEWTSMIVTRFHPDMPEISLIKSNLSEHVNMLWTCIRQGTDGCWR